MEPESLTESLQEVLSVFDEAGEPWTTPEVADRLDIGRRTAYNRLERLVDDDHLKTKKVGASARVWWRPPIPADESGDGDTKARYPGQVNRWEEQFRSLVEATEEYAIFVLDSDGYVQTWNPGAARIKGYDADDIVGRHFSTFYPEDDRERGVPETNLEAAADAGSIQDEGWRLRDDGSRFWANVTITAIRGDDGELIGYAKVTRDMTDRKRVEAERELQHETTRDIAEAETFEDGLQAALQDVCELTEWEYAEVWLPTDDGEIERTDIDYRRGDLAEFAAFSAGQTFDWDGSLPGRVWATGEFEWIADLSTEPLETFPRRKRALDVNLKSALGVPVVADDEVVAVLTFLMGEARDTDDRLVEIVSSVAADLGDLVVRRQIQQKMERERDLIDQILTASPIGIQVLNRKGKVVRMNDRAREILDIPDDRTESYLPPDRRTYGADGERISPDDHPFSRVLATGEPVFDWQTKVELPDGGYRWLTVNAAPVLDADCEVERVVTTGEDITQLKEQTRRLERERDELKTELDEIFERIADGCYAIDDEFRINYVNDHAKELLGLEESSLIGRDIGETVGLTDQFEAALHEAFEKQSPVRVENYNEPLDAWFGHSVFPSESGLSVHFRDITERKEHERELDRTLDLFHATERTANVGGWEIDPDTMEVFWTDHLFDILEIPGDEEPQLDRALDVYHEDDRQIVEDAVEQALDTGEPFDVEVRFCTPSGEVRWLHVQGEPGTAGDEVVSLRGAAQDITGRKERERALKRYETVAETASDVILSIDDRSQIQGVNSAVEEMFGYAPDELIGEPLTMLVPDRLTDAHEAGIAQYLRTGERTLDWDHIELPGVAADGTEIPLSISFSEYERDGQHYFTGIIRDITERKERERELKRKERRFQTLVENFPNGAVALVDDDLRYTTFGGIPAGETDLTREDLEGGLLRDVLPTELADVVIPRYEEALDGNPSRFVDTVDDRVYQFDFLPVRDEDGDIFLAMAMSQDITDRKERERELVQQREQLQALNSLNEVIRGITNAVIEQSTREEIEAVVCERLVESESYLLAWTGEVDLASQTVNIRTEAGVEGYLDDVVISVDPHDERSQGPTGRAFRTNEIQIANDIDGESQHDPWREHIEEYGFRSSAAIPITHGDIVFGVLNVYAARPNAFTGQEREMIAQLGEVIGHAIAAAERKKALLSDDLVELDFQIHDVFGDLDASVELTGKLSLNHTVTVGDGEYLVYGTATTGAIDAMTRLVEVHPHWKSVTVRSEGDPQDFELRVTDPPVLSAVASRGGYLDRAVIEDGDLKMRIHLAPTVDVRQVTEAVVEAYPGAEMVRRRQISRDRDDLHQFQRELLSDLTDRQRTSLEAAFHAGYFEWPRDTSGEEVAESLSVASPTFYQHLRKAERKVFDAIFSASTESTG